MGDGWGSGVSHTEGLGLRDFVTTWVCGSECDVGALLACVSSSTGVGTTTGSKVWIRVSQCDVVTRWTSVHCWHQNFIHGMDDAIGRLDVGLNDSGDDGAIVVQNLNSRSIDVNDQLGAINGGEFLAVVQIGRGVFSCNEMVFDQRSEMIHIRKQRLNNVVSKLFPRGVDWSENGPGSGRLEIADEVGLSDGFGEAAEHIWPGHHGFIDIGALANAGWATLAIENVAVGTKDRAHRTTGWWWSWLNTSISTVSTVIVVTIVVARIVVVTIVVLVEVVAEIIVVVVVVVVWWRGTSTNARRIAELCKRNTWVVANSVTQVCVRFTVGACWGITLVAWAVALISHGVLADISIGCCVVAGAVAHVARSQSAKVIKPVLQCWWPCSAVTFSLAIGRAMGDHGGLAVDDSDGRVEGDAVLAVINAFEGDSGNAVAAGACACERVGREAQHGSSFGIVALKAVEPVVDVVHVAHAIALNGDIDFAIGGDDWWVHVTTQLAFWCLLRPALRSTAAAATVDESIETEGTELIASHKPLRA